MIKHKNLRKILIFILFATFYLNLKSPAHAVLSISHSPDPVYENSGTLTITVKSDTDYFLADGDYSFEAWNMRHEDSQLCSAYPVRYRVKPVNSKTFTASWPLYKGTCVSEIGRWKFQLWYGGKNDKKGGNIIIDDYEFLIETDVGGFPSIHPYQSPLQVDTTPKVILENAGQGTVYSFWWDGQLFNLAAKFTAPSKGTHEITLNESGTDFSIVGPKRLCFAIGGLLLPGTCLSQFSTIFNFTLEPQSTPTITPTPDPKRPPTPTKVPFAYDIGNLCASINSTTDPDGYKTCLDCYTLNKGIWTAMGCISTDISGFVTSFFRIGLGMAGGIALLFLIYGGFLVMTSGGVPETIQQGKDLITSAITGLLLIIFSVFLIQLISVDILQIPGFSTQPVPTSPPTTQKCTDPEKPKMCWVSGNSTCCKLIEQCQYDQDLKTYYCATCPTSLCGGKECCDPGIACEKEKGEDERCQNTPTPTPTLPPPNSLGLSISVNSQNVNPNTSIPVEIKGLKSYYWNTAIITVDFNNNKTDCKEIRVPEMKVGPTSVILTTPNTPNNYASIVVLATYKDCASLPASIKEFNQNTATIQAIQMLSINP